MRAGILSYIPTGLDVDDKTMFVGIREVSADDLVLLSLIHFSVFLFSRVQVLFARIDTCMYS